MSFIISAEILDTKIHCRKTFFGLSTSLLSVFGVSALLVDTDVLSKCRDGLSPTGLFFSFVSSFLEHELSVSFIFLYTRFVSFVFWNGVRVHVSLCGSMIFSSAGETTTDRPGPCTVLSHHLPCLPGLFLHRSAGRCRMTRRACRAGEEGETEGRLKIIDKGPVARSFL